MCCCNSVLAAAHHLMAQWCTQTHLWCCELVVSCLLSSLVPGLLVLSAHYRQKAPATQPVG